MSITLVSPQQSIAITFKAQRKGAKIITVTKRAYGELIGISEQRRMVRSDAAKYWKRCLAAQYTQVGGGK